MSKIDVWCAVEKFCKWCAMYSDGSIARVPSLAAISLMPPKLSKISPGRSRCKSLLREHAGASHVIPARLFAGAARQPVFFALLHRSPPGKRDPVCLQCNEVSHEQRHPAYVVIPESDGYKHRDRRPHLERFANHPAHHCFGATQRSQACREQRARHPADRPSQERGQRSSAGRLIKQPPHQRSTQGQSHLRRHDLERRDTRWTTHVRTKQLFSLSPRERNDIVILLLDIPRIVSCNVLTGGRIGNGAFSAVVVTPILRRLIRRFNRHRSVPKVLFQPASLRCAYGVAVQLNPGDCKR